jgi:membrane protein YqaA with SNARE-associated domain
MTETVSLVSLFVSSFLAATLLPGGSEALLFGVLKAYPQIMWPALGVATLGNTLGGMVGFGMGWLVPQSKALKHVEQVRRFGAPVLLFAWAPLVGDALCLGAGWLRLNPWQAALYMAVGKFARYWVIAYVAA